MNHPSTSVRSDDELLHVTRAVLAENGFSVETVFGDITLVLAEDQYSVVAVAATNTIRELFEAESVATLALAERIRSVALGPKKWDTYLVLLTREKSAENEVVTPDLYAINYDTSRLRRIAHTGVDPTPEAVSHALALFVEPTVAPAASKGSSQGDAFNALLRALTSRGIDEDLAQRAINAFQKGADLDDVL